MVILFDNTKMHPLPDQPGLYKLVHEASGRRFSLWLPQNYSPAKPEALVLALHWGLDLYPFISADFLETLVRPALEPLGAIIVAPERNEETWANPTSEEAVIGLFELLEEHYKIDPAQTLLMGYSMGGIGCWYMAARHQGIFKAAIPISAEPTQDAAEVAWRIPLFVIHGREDEFFPVEKTNATVKELMSRGVAIELQILDNATHFEVGRYIQPLRDKVPWIKGVWKDG
jgi:predicted peptidase